MQLQGVLTLPALAATASDGLGVLVALAQSTALPSGRGESSHLAVFGNALRQPLSVRVSANDLVERIDQNHFEELVGGVLSDPVGAEHSQSSTATSDLALKHPIPCQ